MKTIWKSIRITLACCVLLSVCYILVLWLFARLAGPNQGRVPLAALDGAVVGAANVGQLFTQDIYFWGRPSCAGNGYDASRSGGSNKGPTNPQHLAQVEARIDTFLARHPYLRRSQVPAEMVTASASGLDPDITPASAYMQVERVAQARGVDPRFVKTLVDSLLQEPLMGLYGPGKVNVLQLNIALDERQKQLYRVTGNDSIE